MKEFAMNTHTARGGPGLQAVTDAKRFASLCRLGYTIEGNDAKGFTATDPATGKEIRRLTFDAFAKAIRQAGATRAVRSRLLEKRSDPEYQLRQQIESQRLHLLARERREVCPTKRTPKTIRGTSPHD